MKCKLHNLGVPHAASLLDSNFKRILFEFYVSQLPIVVILEGQNKVCFQGVFLLSELQMLQSDTRNNIF